MEPPSSTEPLPIVGAILSSPLAGLFSSSFFLDFFILVVLLLLAALFSGVEVAYLSLSADDNRRIREGNTKAAKRALRLLRTPEFLQSTISFWTVLVNVLFIVLSVNLALSQSLVSATIGGYIFLAFCIVVVLLIFGEVIPKILAAHGRVGFACFMSYPMLVTVTITKPVTILMVKLSRLISRRKGKNGKLESSIDDLSDAIDIVQSRSDEDKRLLKGIVDLGNTDVKNVMHSRVDVAAVEINTSKDELYAYVLEWGYSRFPVFEDNFDNIKGVLYIKDLLPFLNTQDDSFRWQSLVRSAYFVPEGKRVNDLLREFQQKRIHMAIVVDEYGGTSGIVTLEDILEEIVGEISDETDVDDDLAVKQKDGSFLFEGKATINDFCRTMNVDDGLFEDVEGQVETLAGLVLNIKGGFPVKDESFDFGGYTFKVVDVDSRRVKKIKVKQKNGEEK